MLNYIKVLSQYCLPKHKLSRIIYTLTRIKNKTWKNFLINHFIRLYKVDMKQAIKSKADEYTCFNDFFTRELKPNVRKWALDPKTILSPVDGTISQIGTINSNTIVQAKGKKFILETLLANDIEIVRQFTDGTFCTLYLSPRDYHRIHMPVTGKLKKSIYVPGTLFTVNQPTTNMIDGLFTKNERFVSIFETKFGLMAKIMVGALFVGSMETVWLGQITPTKKKLISILNYDDEQIILKQGKQFGHFNMGSTVILLFEKNKIKWLDEIKKGAPIKVGEILGNLI